MNAGRKSLTIDEKALPPGALPADPVAAGR